MKICSKCKIAKPIGGFPVNKSKKDGRGYICRECHKLYTKSHYKRNRQQYLNKNKRSNERNIEFCKRVKSLSGCCKCNEQRWWVMQFHHVNDKDHNISTLARSSCSLETLKKELRKCIVLCANCHMDLHHKPS